MGVCFTSHLNQLHRFDSVSAFPLLSTILKADLLSVNDVVTIKSVCNGRSSAVCQFAAVSSVKFGMKLAKMFVYDVRR